jgi:YidC/Oxa1 family membrane protein insertase
MEDKKFLLALTLSLLVLMIYSSIMPKPQHIDNKYVANNMVAENKTASIPHSSSPGVIVPDKIVPKALSDNEIYTFKSSGLDLTFSLRGGYIFSAKDSTLNAPLVFKDIGLIPQWSGYVFKPSEILHGVVLEYVSDDGHKIKRTYRIKSDNSLEITVGIYDITDSKVTNYNIFAGYFDPKETKNPESQRYFEVSVHHNDVVFRKPATSIKKNMEIDGNIHLAALRDRYFCAVIIPQLPVNKSDIVIENSVVSLNLLIPERTLTQGTNYIEDSYKIYLGPQNEKLLKAFDPRAQQVINYGIFDAISRGLLFLLNTSHSVTRNWGWSIIATTILVYLLLFPLSIKSMVSMKRMQALQPKIEELKAKFKDNAQKLNIEIMALYKREKVNPLGGCVPMLLQIPVFFSLYQLLMRLISLKGAHFLWIKDLSEPDRLTIFGQSYPIIGSEFNLLPILMAGAMFLQQRISTQNTSTSSASAEQQKIMGIMMPVVFGFLFYKMPSGLVLYWLVNSLLMYGFQWKILKAKTS